MSHHRPAQEHGQGRTRGRGIRSVATAALAGVLILVGLAWWLLADQETHPGVGQTRPAETATAVEPGALPRGRALEPTALQLVTEPLVALPTTASAPDAAPLPPGVVTFAVTGRVVDPQGRAIAGSLVRLVPDESTSEALGSDNSSYDLDLESLDVAVTGLDGRFTLPGHWLPGHGLDRIVGIQTSPVLLVAAEEMALHAYPLPHHDGLDRDVGDLVVGMRAATITARLVDERGMPIEGVRAGISSWGPDETAKGLPGLADGRSFNLMGLARARSDAAGRLAIEGLWPSECTVSFSHLLFTSTQRRDVVVPPGEVLDLGDVVLARGGSVAGAVYDERGAPVADAEVWARKADDLWRMRVVPPEDWERMDLLHSVLDKLHDSRAWSNSRSPVRTDAGGRFDRPGLDGDLVDVIVEAAGHEPLRVAAVPVGTGDLRIVLRTETNLTVTLVDDATGEAAPGATLRAFRWADAAEYGRPLCSERRVTRGPAAGAFVVHDVGTRDAWLVAQASARATRVVLIPGPEPESEVSSSKPAAVVVRMQPQAVVGGLVEDPQGAPVAGATVTLVHLTGEGVPEVPGGDLDLGTRWRLTTKADGRFRFEQLPAGAFALQSACAGYRAIDDVPLQLAAGQQVDLPPIVLVRACALAGTVRSADGTAAAGLVVTSEQQEPGGEILRGISLVDRAGAYAIGDLQAGRQVVAVSARLEPGPYLTTEVVLEESATHTLDLVLPRFAVLRGVVTAGGRPVAEARIRAERQDVEAGQRVAEWLQESDEAGRFVLEIRQEGHYRVVAEQRGGGASQPLSLQAVWGLDVAFDFELGSAALAGRVVDEQSKAAPTDVELRLLRDGQPATDWAATLDDGAFEFAPLLAGMYAVETRGEAYAPTVWAEELQLEEGQRREGLVVPIARGAALDVLVLDKQGEPDGAWLYLVTSGDPPQAARHGAPEGRLRIEGLAAGRYRLVVARLGYDEALLDPRGAQDIARWEEAAAEIVLSAGEQQQVTLQRMR